MIKIFFSGFGDKTIPMPLMDPSLEAYSVQIQDEYDKNTSTTKGLEDSQKLMQNLGLNQVWEFYYWLACATKGFRNPLISRIMKM